MIKILKIVQKSFILVCLSFSIHANAMEMLDYTEKPEGLICIASKNKYPSQIFDSQNFVDEIEKKIKFTENSIVDLDISNDASVNSGDIAHILYYLRRNNIPLSSLNISGTNIEEGIVAELKDLLDDEKFKLLDISGTHAAAHTENLAENPKIIFMLKKDYDRVDKFYLQYKFGIELINRHIKYYIEKGYYFDD